MASTPIVEACTVALIRASDLALATNAHDVRPPNPPRGAHRPGACGAPCMTLCCAC